MGPNLHQIRASEPHTRNYNDSGVIVVDGVSFYPDYNAPNGNCLLHSIIQGRGEDVTPALVTAERDSLYEKACRDLWDDDEAKDMFIEDDHLFEEVIKFHMDDNFETTRAQRMWQHIRGDYMSDHNIVDEAQCFCSDAISQRTYAHFKKALLDIKTYGKALLAPILDLLDESYQVMPD